MIRLSAEQFMMIENKALHAFVGRVVEALPDYAGPLVAHRPRPVVFKAAQEAVRRAERYGLQTERELFHYCQLTVMLGAAFDTDPALPWAGVILRDDTYVDAAEKLDDLWNTAMDYMDAVFDAEAGSFPIQAYRAYLARGPVPQELGQRSVIALDDLAAIWPEKAAFLPFEVFKAGVSAAAERAADWGLDLPAQWRFCRIAFLLGYAFDADPLHDWAGPVLDQSTSAAQRMDALEEIFERIVVQPALATDLT